MSKRSIACNITPRVREIVKKRDRGCIFCQCEYHMPPDYDDIFLISLNSYQIMHFVPRSQGGLGAPENLAMGCVYHHDMMDNGSGGRRAEMMQFFEDYLRKHYPGWKKEDQIYRKWRF